VHKVIHLVVSTFEQGWRSWWSEWVGFHYETVTGHEGLASGQCWRRSVVVSDLTCTSGHFLRLADASDWTLRRHYSSSGRLTCGGVLAHRVERQRDRTLTTSGHWWPDASSHDLAARGPYWKWPNARRRDIRWILRRVRLTFNGAGVRR
jgi:hypothetical protein